MIHLTTPPSALLASILFFPCALTTACAQQRVESPERGSRGATGTAQDAAAKRDAKANAGIETDGDIVALATRAGRFHKLLAAAKAARLVDTLRAEGPLTLFAPTDAAFDKLPADALKALLADQPALERLLLYHVVPGRVTARQVAAMDWATTAQGQSLRVRADDDGVRVDDARVTEADLMAENGVIHVIDTVLAPRPDLVATAAAAGDFGTLAKALQAAGLVEALRGKGPFTVFAPTDAAFAKLPDGTLQALLAQPERLKAILTYHVIPGRVLSTDLPPADDGATSATPKTLQGQSLRVVRTDGGAVTVDGANVTTADVLAGNGVIHVIDRVILPPSK